MPKSTHETPSEGLLSIEGRSQPGNDTSAPERNPSTIRDRRTRKQAKMSKIVKSWRVRLTLTVLMLLAGGAAALAPVSHGG
ncbi:hypothetical protein [Streptomyces apricus]|uniref:hypothetical protein n=1 Tax=Streptomyces apricus TaxID=1828112 RepID=UPI001CAA857E|nr:hypothetical protein [Streptomyces apricus]